MSAIALTVIGSGNLSLLPHVMGGLASWYGERPLDIRLFDPSFDNLELSFRIGQSLCLIAGSTHELNRYDRASIALDGAARVIYMAADLPSTEANQPSLLVGLAELFAEVPVLNLTATEVPPSLVCQTLLTWPMVNDGASGLSFAFQLLRWANSEEYPTEFLQPEMARPLHRWLDDPNVTEL